LGNFAGTRANRFSAAISRLFFGIFLGDVKTAADFFNFKFCVQKYFRARDAALFEPTFAGNNFVEFFRGIDERGARCFFAKSKFNFENRAAKMDFARRVNFKFRVQFFH